jgi:hypothetical protein
MSRKALLAKVVKLRAITEERGASPAEAANAASLARRLTREIRRRRDADTAIRGVRRAPRAPGVHVDVVASGRPR